jgi:hypothetical protein
VVVVSENGGPAALYIWLAGEDPPGPVLELQLQRSVPVRVARPQLQPGVEWKVRVDNALVCPAAR